MRNLRLRFDCDFIRNSKNINIDMLVIIRTLPWTCWGGGGGAVGTAPPRPQLTEWPLVIKWYPTIVSPTIKNLTETPANAEQLLYQTEKNSHQRFSIKMLFLKILQYSCENTCVKLLRTSVLKSICVWLLLN